jgi:hypothetical protein
VIIPPLDKQYIHSVASFKMHNFNYTQARSYIDSMRQAHSLDGYCLQVFDSTWIIFAGSGNPVQDLDAYLYRQLADTTLSVSKRQLVRSVVRIAQGSWQYWNANPPITIKKQNGGIQRVAVPAWLAIDAAGGLVGAIGGWISGDSWGGIGKKALVGAAGASFLKWMRVLYP